MSTPQFKSRDAMVVYVWKYVGRRAKSNIRFRKLRGGPDTKQAVINGAALRLLTPVPSDPVELLSEPLQKKMRQPLPPPIGNLQLHRSPTDAPEWVAFVNVYRQLFELGSFWSVSGAERDALVDRAINAERMAYTRATASVSPPADETIDQSKQENLSRLTEAGQALANDPAKSLQQQAQTAAEENLIAAQRELRAKVEAAEDAKLCRAGVEYYRKLPWKQRQAFHLVCASILSDAEIARQCQIARATVARIRSTLEGLGDQFQTLPAYEVEGGASVVEVPTAALDAPQVESANATRVADAADYTVTVDATAKMSRVDLSKSVIHSDVLDVASALQAPEVDDDISEEALHCYARRTDRLLGSRWGHGKKFFSISALTTANDPSWLAERDQYANKELSPAELQALVKQAAAADLDLIGTRRGIDAYVTRREQEAANAAKEFASLLRRTIVRKKHTDAEVAQLAELRAFAEPLFRDAGRERDLDAVLVDALALGPKPSG